MYSEKRTYTEEEYRLGLLEQTNVGILETLDKIDNRLNQIERKLDNKFDVIEVKFDDIRKEMKSDFRWVLFVMGTLSTALTGIVAHGFHWF